MSLFIMVGALVGILALILLAILVIDFFLKK